MEDEEKTIIIEEPKIIPKDLLVDYCGILKLDKQVIQESIIKN